MNFLKLFFRTIVLIPGVVQGTEALFGAKTGEQKKKAAVEKTLNEVQLKLIDLETKGYSSASQDIKFLHKRIQEVGGL